MLTTLLLINQDSKDIVEIERKEDQEDGACDV